MPKSPFTFPVILGIVGGTISITWGVSWYLMGQKEVDSAQETRLVQVEDKVASFNNNYLHIMDKLSMLDTIYDGQKNLRSDVDKINSDVNKLNKVVRTTAKTVIHSRDTLINIFEQLPPLFSQKKNESPIPTPHIINLVNCQ